MVDSLANTVVVGHGPARLIATHGWMADSRLFGRLHELIDPDRYSVAFPDCRGYGARCDVDGEFTVEEIARDILQLADHLGWNSFSALGHSMAGMSVQRLLADASSRIENAILLAPVPAGGARINADRKALLTQAVHEPQVRMELMNANTGRVRPNEWLEELLALSLSGTRATPMLQYIASWGGQSFEGDVRGASTAVSILIGELDPGTPEPAMQDRIASLFPNSRLTKLTAVGHYAMWEDPAALWTEIEAILT